MASCQLTEHTLGCLTIVSSPDRGLPSTLGSWADGRIHVVLTAMLVKKHRWK